MAFGLWDAVGSLEEFHGMPGHSAALQKVSSFARAHGEGAPLRAEVRRIKRAFGDYRAEVAFMGELWG